MGAKIEKNKNGKAHRFYSMVLFCLQKEKDKNEMSLSFFCLFWF